MTQLSKSAYRKQARQIRCALDIPSLSRQICQQVEAWRLFKAASTILAYSALEDEIDLRPLIHLYPHKNWYLPRVLETNGLDFHQYRLGETLIPNRFGVLEPLADSPLLALKEPDCLIFVPCLMLDQQGVRLGFGKGYYDRFLANLPCEVLTASPLPQMLLVKQLPRDEWDVPVGWAITEQGISQL